MIFIVRIHAIGVPEGVTLLEFKGANQEEEPEVQEANEAAAEEELPKCPDHRPSSFLKGKPWSILSLPCFYKYRNWLEPIVALYILPCPDIALESYLSSGTG
jgi:hypothetical protein